MDTTATDEQHELTYTGRTDPAPGTLLSPDTRGRAWKIIAAVYDQAADRTFVTVEPAQVSTR